MSEVVIAGIGQTPVEEHWDKSLRKLAYYALEAAMEDSGGLRPQALFVGNMLASQLSRQAHLGALIADFAGLIGIEAATIEAGNASGGAALRAGYMAVASGQVDVALVVGVEKFSDMVGSDIDAALATGGDSDYEAVQGLTPTAVAALLMRRYLYETGATHQAFAGFPLVAHANGAGNPNAMYRKPIKPETYLNAGLVSDPLNLFDVAPYADGAAAVILTASTFYRRTSRTALCASPARRSPPIPWRCTTAPTRSTSARPASRLKTPARKPASPRCKPTCSSCTMPTRSTPPYRWRPPGLRPAARAGSWPRTAIPRRRSACRDHCRSAPWAGSSPRQPRRRRRDLPGGRIHAAAALPGWPEPGTDARRALIQSLGGPASTAATHVLEVIE